MFRLRLVCPTYDRPHVLHFYQINSPFIMGRNVVVLGGSDDFGYGISASEGYPDVCVFEYVCDFAYLWGNLCECCPSLVFVRACV